MPRRKLTTKEANIRARNRANAQKSTGPKTAAGKARAARNAVRHGLASAADDDPREQAAAEAHRAALAAHLRLGGPGAAGAVDRLARALARLERIDALESELVRADAAGPLGADPAALRRLGGLDRYRARALSELKRARREIEAAQRNAEFEANAPIFRAGSAR